MPSLDLTGSAFWTPAAAAHLTGGRWLIEPADPAAALTGLTTDSRSLAPGQVFLALRGERFDGHDYLPAALAQGAGLAIVERRVDVRSEGVGVLLVDDAVAALHALARGWRDVLREAGCRVIAVAGSNGKTTTRHLVHAALGGKLTGTQSPKSFNNHLGVPLTLLAARAAHDFVAVEIGSNHPGEVAQLCAIAQPDAAIVTSIGREHLEHFGSLDAVAMEEGAVLAALPAAGVAIVHDEAWPMIKPHVELSAGVRLVRYGESNDADVRLITSEPAPRGQRLTVTPGGSIELPLLGRHNAVNALAAVAAARWLGVDDDAAAAALARVEPVEGRLQVLRYGPVTVLHDAYNANPDSVAAALRTLAEQPVGDGGRRVAVLGDMFELGPASPDEHRGVGERLIELGDAVGLVVVIGALSMFIAEGLQGRWPGERLRVFAGWDDTLPGTVADALRPGDVVLIKASRGMKLERLLPAIEAKFGASRR